MVLRNGELYKRQKRNGTNSVSCIKWIGLLTIRTELSLELSQETANQIMQVTSGWKSTSVYLIQSCKKSSCSVDSSGSMSIQTTLFGRVVKDEQHIYKVPQNKYEKFIELWWQRARRENPGASKK